MNSSNQSGNQAPTDRPTNLITQNQYLSSRREKVCMNDTHFSAFSLAWQWPWPAVKLHHQLLQLLLHCSTQQLDSGTHAVNAATSSTNISSPYDSTSQPSPAWAPCETQASSTPPGGQVRPVLTAQQWLVWTDCSKQHTATPSDMKWKQPFYTDTGWCIERCNIHRIIVDRTTGQFWKRSALINAWRMVMLTLCWSVLHDHRPVQLSMLAVSKTARLPDLHKTHMVHFLRATWYLAQNINTKTTLTRTNITQSLYYTTDTNGLLKTAYINTQRHGMKSVQLRLL